MHPAAPAAPAELVNIATNPVPEGGRVGYFLTQDKVRIRYAVWPKLAGTHRGTVCIAQGRTEFIEKYFETIEDFRKRGFSVATFDWRGQGGSDRLIGNKSLGYVDRFDDYWCDLKSFHAEILLPDCPPPFYLVGHSMGGLVSLFAGMHDRLMFDRIFLSAPMVGLDRPTDEFRRHGQTGGHAEVHWIGAVADRAARPTSRRQQPAFPIMR